MRVLVTGGAGFIGSHVVGALLQRGDTVVCVDNFNPYYSPDRKHRNITQFTPNPRFELHQVDIRDARALEEVFASRRIDKIIHLAAMAGVRPSIENPRLYEEVNVGGTINLLDLARRNEVESFVFASSSSVYGLSNRVPFREDDRADSPISPYAATKRAAELMVKTYHHLYGFNCACLRFFTAYGPRGRPDMAPYLFTKWIEEGRPVRVFGDGTTRRDYTFIDDIVPAVLTALDSGFAYEVFNIGNSTTVELCSLIGAIERALGVEAKLEYAPPQPGDVPLTYADISKARSMLGYSPKVGVEEGIRRFVEWYRMEAVTTGN